MHSKSNQRMVVNRDHPISRNLLVDYRIDDRGGQVMRAHDPRYDLTRTGVAGAGSWRPRGWYMDGGDVWDTPAVVPNVTGSNYALCLTFICYSSTAFSWEHLVSCRTGPDNFSLEINSDGGGTVRYIYLWQSLGPSGFCTLRNDFDIQDGKPHTVVWDRAGGEPLIYMDGREVTGVSIEGGTWPATTAPDTATNMAIGGFPGGSSNVPTDSEILGFTAFDHHLGANAARALSGNPEMHLKPAVPNNVIPFVPASGIILTPNGLSHAQTIDAPALTQGHQVAPDDLAQAQTLDSPALIQANIVTPDDVAQIQTVDAPIITQGYVMTPNGIDQLQTIDAPTLAPSGVVVVQGLSQAQTLDDVVLTQANIVSPADLTQAQTVESPDISMAIAIAVNGLSQGQAIDAVLLTQGDLQIDDVTQLQTTGSPVILGANSLTPDDLAQVQRLFEGFDLPPGTVILVNNATLQTLLENVTEQIILQ